MMQHKYQPELIVNARDFHEVEMLILAGADIIEIGHQSFGLRTLGDINLEDINRATSLAHKHGKQIRVLVNAIFNNSRINEVKEYLNALNEIRVDAVVISDPAILTLIKEMQFDIPLHWNPETLGTNTQTLKFWVKRGIERVSVSNELSLESIEKINKELSVPIDIQVQGMTNIFQSKRNLVKNYYNHIDEALKTNSAYYIRQPKEEPGTYPVYEDTNGTHIMSKEDLCMIEYIPAILARSISGLKINGFLQSKENHISNTKIYRTAIDQSLENKVIDTNYFKKLKYLIIKSQDKDRSLGTGFYFKEQIY
ncbi:putative protease [Saliterribacillus persicus]|uniref:Putative protease n=2 Tax=Saliterribacillus persicus TaxID=930114 RepID=A0A368X7D7_9BACI|nr:putative protease [Saliterribacillus persicus]